MKFLDLFSGIGGFRLGMEMNGHECVGHCEIDKYADKSYRAMHDVKENEYYANDIRGIIPSELPDFDCICGGFPCQSFSIAGKRGGFEDTRGTLFFEIARIIQERKPRLVFLENVAGLLSHDDGSTFETIIGTLDELGYDVEWQICNSKDFGVPQNRERVFIIGHIRGSCRRTVFPIRESDKWINESNTKTTQTDIFPTIDTRVGATTHGSPYVIKQVGQIYGTDVEPNPQAGRIYSPDGISPTMDTCQGGNIYNDICPTLGARDYKEPRCVKINCLNTKNQDGVQPHQHERVYHTDGLLPALNAEINGRNNIAIPVLTPDRSKKRQNGRRFKEDGDVMFTLTAQDKHGVMVKEATKQGYAIAEEGDSINLAVPGSETRRGRVGKGIANTLDTSCNQGILVAKRTEYGKQIRKKYESGEIKESRHNMTELEPRADGITNTISTVQKDNLLFTGYRIRKLTPLECFRLQGFPDELFYKAKAVNSDSQLYKQAGNSVTVNVIYEIAKKFEFKEEIYV